MDARSVHQARLFVGTLLLLLFSVGCQRGPAALLTVSGKVAYKGVPIPGGTIVFTPDAGRGEAGPIAYGIIKSDGTYQLTTGEAGGAAPGWYRVTVASLAADAQPHRNQRFAVPPSLLPEKYS